MLLPSALPGISTSIGFHTSPRAQSTVVAIHKCWSKNDISPLRHPRVALPETAT